MLLYHTTIVQLLLVGHLQLYIRVASGSRDCNGLKMFDENGQVLSFNCTDYDGTPSCRSGANYFPAHLRQNSYVSKPRDFQVSKFRRIFTDESGGQYQSTGLTFQWKVPTDEASRRSTKGYYIKMMKAGTGSQECRLFDLLNYNLTNSNLRFSYEFFPFNNTALELYVVRLFSLPLPGSNYDNNKTLYAQASVNVPERTDLRPNTVVEPGDWTTWVRVKKYPAHGIVQVDFGLPVEGSLANFSSFQLKIVHKQPSPVLYSAVYNVTVGSRTTGSYNFSSVPSGTYQMIVSPRNLGCQCWKMHSFFGKDCHGRCKWSRSEYFNFTSFKANTVVEPRYWTTFVRVRKYPAQGIVQVDFDLPVEGSLAKFSSFDVKIMHKQPRQILNSSVYNVVGSETVGSYNFSNVPNGTYQATVSPRDLGCQCWSTHPDSGRKECTGQCEWSYSDFFDFTRSTVDRREENEGSPTPDSTKGSSESHQGFTESGPEATKDRPSDSTIVWLAAVLSVACVIAFIFVAWCLVRRRRAKQGCTRSRNSNNSGSWKDCETDKLGPGVPLDAASIKKELDTPQLERKTVLLLASEDHTYFQQAVDMFARFLQLHCRCDVLFAPQQTRELRKTANSYCWLSRHVDTVDFVVIVTSEAASHLYSAFQAGQSYKEADLGPEGDLFTPGLQHICGKIACNESVANVLMVHFDHTAPSLHLPIAPLRSRLYHLPPHLTSFLLHIHGLDGRTMDLSQVPLPLKGNVEALALGQEWLTAVRESSTFERLHPDWFERKFGTPVESLAAPLPNKLLGFKKDSRDSGIGELRDQGSLQRRSSSVSTRAWQRSGESSSPDQTKENRDHRDFIAPSVFLSDGDSAVTAHFSEYMTTERPPEIDGGSTYTEQFRKLNERYEQELQRNEDRVPEWGLSAMTEEKPDEKMYLFPQSFQEDLRVGVDSDCSSLSSAQSV